MTGSSHCSLTNFMGSHFLHPIYDKAQRLSCSFTCMRFPPSLLDWNRVDIGKKKERCELIKVRNPKTGC